MNLRDLRYLIAAADTEHFGKAAERCHVSQPTLSAQIRKLEETLGVALFERSHRSVALTETGREVAAHARRVLEEVRRMEALAESRQDPLAGELRIGIIPTLCAYLLPHLLPPLERCCPALRPIVFEETTASLLQRLRGHEIDAALLATRHDEDDLVCESLFDERLWVALARGHPLAARERIERSALDGVELLTLAEGHCLADRVRELCSVSSAPRFADLRATSLETLLQLVAAGEAATLVPELAVPHAARGETLAFRPFALEDGYRRIRLLYRRSSSRREALVALGEAVKEAARASGATRIPSPDAPLDTKMVP